ncbi:nucleoside deaminase [Rhodoplanes sp. TEM]|uniref:Nucleoside deaminase n=1 Tax=Rhodoplanes tepidamans TaxID=200616 RepID=A0ABT5J943_RHOTP|nr:MULTISPECIES: nucleoside deaminase [Rhodoplanes]MDC7785585.1 nucleoside deaminase [Rhodoplanes tepidamans]MDC7985216.1 nucleoside deaminase [Rhodoplanes sp. TEM]MDQ0353245.1 tRNA(adenine34) deaminase [Rhodoplanes tepidamans]
MPDHQKFMRIAIDEAKRGAAMGEQPFGAVVAIGDEVIVSTPSLKVGTCDTTAHSETLAIGLATKKLGRREIPEATFYCTCEPCPMCCGAVLNAGIRTMVIGARNRHVKSHAKLAFNFKDYTVERLAEMVGWDLTVVEGVLQDECVALYSGAAVPLTR